MCDVKNEPQMWLLEMRICLGHWGRLLKGIVGLFSPRYSVLFPGPGVSMCSLIPASWRLLHCSRKERGEAQFTRWRYLAGTKHPRKTKSTRLSLHWREMKWYRGFRYLRCTAKYILCSLWLPLVWLTDLSHPQWDQHTVSYLFPSSTLMFLVYRTKPFAKQHLKNRH